MNHAALPFDTGSRGLIPRLHSLGGYPWVAAEKRRHSARCFCTRLRRGATPDSRSVIGSLQERPGSSRPSPIERGDRNPQTRSTFLADTTAGEGEKANAPGMDQSRLRTARRTKGHAGRTFTKEFSGGCWIRSLSFGSVPEARERGSRVRQKSEE